MTFDIRAEEIFSRVFNRPVSGPKERSFLESAAQRKQGGALQGALEFKQQQGGGQTASPQAQTSNKDPLDEMIANVEKAARQVDEKSKGLFKKELQNELQTKLLSNPAIKKLLEREGEADKRVQDFDPGVESSELARSTQLGALKGTELSGDIQTAGEFGRAFALRGGGISQIIQDITEGKEQELTASQANLQAQQGLLTSTIQGQQALQEAELFPLRKRKIQAEIAKIQSSGSGAKVLSVADSIALGVPFGTTDEQAFGISAKTTDEQKKENALGDVSEVVSRFKEISPSVNTEDSRFKQVAKYGVSALNRTNDDIIKMQAMGATLASIVKLFGDTGRLSDQDLERAELAVPNWQDPKSAAEVKVQQLDEILNKALNTAEGTHQRGEEPGIGDQLGPEALIDNFLDSF